MGKFLRLINGIPRMVEESTSPTIYDEDLTVVASGASGENEINLADTTTGTPITLPKGGTYLSNDIEIHLNGKLVHLLEDYNYVGPEGVRTQVSFTFDMEVGDIISFRAENASEPIFSVPRLEPTLWLKSDVGVLDSGAAAASDLEDIFTWQDQSGNDNHLLKRYGTHFRYAATPSVSFYGYPAIDGYSALGVLQTPDANTNIIMGPEATVVVVFSPREDLTILDEHLFASGLGGGGSGTPYAVVLSENAGVNQTIGLNGSTQAEATFNFDEKQYILCKFKNGASNTSAVYRNGVLSETAASPLAVANNDGFTIGNADDGGKCYQGYIAEVIVVPRLLNDAEIANVDTYIKDKYAIT